MYGIMTDREVDKLLKRGSLRVDNHASLLCSSTCQQHDVQQKGLLSIPL